MLLVLWSIMLFLVFLKSVRSACQNLDLSDHFSHFLALIQCDLLMNTVSSACKSCQFAVSHIGTRQSLFWVQSAVMEQRTTIELWVQVFMPLGFWKAAKLCHWLPHRISKSMKGLYVRACSIAKRRRTLPSSLYIQRTALSQQDFYQIGLTWS